MANPSPSPTLAEMMQADELIQRLGQDVACQLLMLLTGVERHGYGSITLHVNKGRINLVEAAMRYTPNASH